MILALGFPNPVGWVVDQVTGFVGDVATEGFEMVIGGLTAWIVDADASMAAVGSYAVTAGMERSAL